MFTETLGAFLADFGVPVTCGSSSFVGILDKPDETMSAAGVNVLSTMYLLQVLTSDVQAAAIVSGVALQVAGQAFTVRDVLSHEDGAFSMLTLSK